MTAHEWEILANLFAIVQMAAHDICEFIDGHMKSEIKNILCNAGVSNYVEDAYHDVIVNVRRNASQLEEVDLAEPWLRRVIMSTAKKYRPRYGSYPGLVSRDRETAERPKQVGSKTIMIDGKEQIVRIFGPGPPQKEPPAKKLLLEPSSDSAIVNGSKANRPDYPRKIDVWSAMAKLPRRWAVALCLVCVAGLSAAEAAEIMGCTVERVHKLVQKAKRRMRELLPGYGRNGVEIPESQSWNATHGATTHHALLVQRSHAAEV